MHATANSAEVLDLYLATSVDQARSPVRNALVQAGSKSLKHCYSSRIKLTELVDASVVREYVRFVRVADAWSALPVMDSSIRRHARDARGRAKSLAQSVMVLGGPRVAGRSRKGRSRKAVGRNR